MGILSEFRKLLFGAKAVGKSATNKAVDYTKEKGKEIAEDAEELWEKTRDKAEDLGDKVKEKGEELWDKAKDSGEKLKDNVEDKLEELFDFDRIDKQEEATDPTGDEPAGSSKRNKGEDLWEKGRKKSAEILEKADKATEKLREKAGEATEKIVDQTDKAWEKAEDVGEKLVEKSDQLWEKAEDVGEKVFDKAKDLAEKGKSWLEELSDKAEAEKAQEKKERDIFEQAHSETEKSDVEDTLSEAEKLAGDIEKKVRDTSDSRGSDSTLTGKDDFFERARRFAEGDYHNTGKNDPKPEGTISISDDDNPPPRKKDGGKLPGFEDHDGDGNELIDDAILDDEDTDEPKDA
jgi:ElaB/YqjD/DUF883 family membrane-anchored ribosome-binding protein